MLKRQGNQVWIINFYFNNLWEEDPASTIDFPQSVNKESSSNNVCLELLCFKQKVEWNIQQRVVVVKFIDHWKT